MFRCLAAILLCTATLIVSQSGLAKKNHNEPYKEFQRALGIVERTQLTMFRDSTPEEVNEILLDYRQRVMALAPEQDSEEKRVAIMRKMLVETIEGYNDIYANYIDPQSLKSYRERRQGNYTGIGLKFRTRVGDYPVVIGALLGGPLEEADILPGDSIVAADAKDLRGLTSSEVVRLLKGPEDSNVMLTIKRDNTPSHQLRATRKAVDLHYARAEMLQGNIGYIKISRFGGRTHARVAEQLKKLERRNAAAYILDLRDNPGGSTRAARAIVSMFSKRDVVYCERYVTGKSRNQPRHGKHITNKPLAVLINGDSMSSSEIVAGALQAYDRGIIIGSPSYGKGLVQQVFDLAEPLGGAIRTTIAVFGRPDHELIHGAGIVPDYYVESESDFMFRQTGSLNLAANAREFQRDLLEQSLRVSQPEDAERHILARDIQLDKAIDVLRTEITRPSSPAVER